MLGSEEHSNSSLFDKKLKNYTKDLAKVIFSDSIRENQELGSPVNK